MNFQPQIIQRTPKKKLKKCPDCECEFSRCKKAWSREFQVETKICPLCGLPIFYRKINSQSVAIPFEDKALVDSIVGKINANLRRLSGFNLNESTAKERKFAYSMISWAMSFLDGAEADIGMTTHEFIEGLIDFVLADDWWGEHLTSLLMISNTRQRLAWDYWESEARKRNVDTPRAARTRKRLQELIKEMPT